MAKRTPTRTAPRRRAIRAATNGDLGRVLASAASDREDWLRDKGAHEATAWTSGELPEPMRRLAVLKSRREFLKSPLYGGVLGRFLDFVLGDGVTIEGGTSAVDRHLQESIEANRFHERLPRALAHLFRDGEYLWTVRAPDRGTGAPISHMRLGRLDPLGVKDLVVDALDEDDVHALTWSKGGGEDLDLALVRPDVEPKLIGKTSGKNRAQHVLAAFWRVNQSGARGLPILIRTMDHAADLDNLVGKLVAQMEYARRFLIHITHNIPDDSEKKEGSKVLAFEKQALAFAQGMEGFEALVTSGGPEGVRVNTYAPDMKIVDAKALYDIVLEMCLGGEGIPKMWFGSGGETNRATAAEQGTPAFRRITRTQGEIRALIQDLMRAFLMMGARAGVAGVKPDSEFNVTMATVATRDSERDVREIAALVAGLMSAVDAGAISREEAAKMIRGVVASKSFGDVIDGEELPEPEEPDPAAPLPPGQQPPPGAKGKPGDEPDEDPAAKPEVPPKRTKESKGGGPLRRPNPHRARAAARK